MAITSNWQRPFSEAAQTVGTALTYTLTENAGRAVIDVTATVNSETKLISRIIITPYTDGRNQTHKVKHLAFPGTNASDYTSATNPADSAATNASDAIELILPDAVDMDAYYTAQGVARTDPTP